MKEIINQLFEIRRKASEQQLDCFDRNLRRAFHELEEMGYKIVDPTGNRYDQRDASVEASLVSPDATNITRVLKPVIYQSENGAFNLVQRGVVIVE